ncbi:MAG: ThuA domain-containing protein [Armatimonadetes bacterium]|nr:ThuA domain-containing protein [Armatimonadota bacterium]
MPHALPDNGKIQVAVVTGGHAFQVPPFYAVFRDMPEVDFYPQALDEYTADAKLAGAYDVVVFYHMHQFRPGDELPWYQKQFSSTLERLGSETQGICVLHHGIVAFQEWPFWSDLVGIEDRTLQSFHMDQSVEVEVADPDHPITRGLSGWTMIDETYRMADADPENGNHLLLTTSHPKSMRTLAWTREFRGSRVFCYQAGHDTQTFDDPNFRRVMDRGIRWLARRESEGPGKASG